MKKIFLLMITVLILSAPAAFAHCGFCGVGDEAHSTEEKAHCPLGEECAGKDCPHCSKGEPCPKCEKGEPCPECEKAEKSSEHAHLE